MLRVSTRLLTIAFFFSAIGGCHGHKITPIHPFGQDFRSYEGLCVSVKPGDYLKLAKEAAEIEEMVVIRLYDLAIFDTTSMGLCQDTGKALLNVEAVMTKVKPMSVFKQLLTFSIDYDKTSLAVDVTFIDAVTSDTLGIYYVSGQSSDQHLSGHSDAATGQVARGIVELVRENLR